MARLMREMGLKGAIRGKPIRTTVSDKVTPCPLDKVNRQFRAPAPNMPCLSDFTYVGAWAGFVYVRLRDRRLCSPDKRTFIVSGKRSLPAGG